MTSAIDAREDKAWRTIYLIYGLYVLGLMTSGLSMLIGVVIAHMKAGEGPNYATNAHYKRLIDIFWTVIVVGLVGTVLSVVGIGFLILLLLGLWTIYAVAKGGLAAINREEI